LCAACIALADLAIYFLNPLWLPRKLLESADLATVTYAINRFGPNQLLTGSGEPLLLICVMSVYSFALSRLFYQLERKKAFEFNNDADSYGAWMVIPAFVTGNLLNFYWCATTHVIYTGF
jgi:hypothetical protein